MTLPKVEFELSYGEGWDEAAVGVLRVGQTVELASSQSEQGTHMVASSQEGKVLGYVPPEPAQAAWTRGSTAASVRSIRKQPTGPPRVLLRLVYSSGGTTVAPGTTTSQSVASAKAEAPLPDDDSGFQLSHEQLRRLASSDELRLKLQDERLQHLLTKIDDGSNRQREQVLEQALLNDADFRDIADQMVALLQHPAQATELLNPP